MLFLHSELVSAAQKWLQSRTSVVITELATIGEEPDVLGWQNHTSTLIECKISRADFAADKKKIFRQFPEMGIGNLRYYCTPPDLIAVEEIRPGWGLIEWNGKRMRTVKKPERFAQINRNQENSILISVLRRIGQTVPVAISIKCYTYETKNRATLGVQQTEEPCPQI